MVTNCEICFRKSPISKVLDSGKRVSYVWDHNGLCGRQLVALTGGTKCTCCYCFETAWFTHIIFPVCPVYSTLMLV